MQTLIAESGVRGSRLKREVPLPVPRGKLLDIQLGYALLRDRRVSLKTKGFAFAVGVAAVALLTLLEIPLEEIIAMLVPFLGGLGDIALDGAEAVFGPLLLALVLLPYLAPRSVVKQVRRERAFPGGASDEQVIDV